LANSYAVLGQHIDALKLHEETLALRRAKLGPDHPATLQSMWHVAKSLVKVNRNADAVPIIDDCVQRAGGTMVDASSAIELRLRIFKKREDPAGCRQSAEMWENLNRTDAASLYKAACMRAVTATVFRATDESAQAAKQAEAEADRAMAWLKQA